MSLNNLKKRLAYRGGAKQTDRMIADKARSFEQALGASYQSATAVLTNGREYQCLINPNKLNIALDDKMLSISFDAKVQCGDVIKWKENNTHWLIYTQYLQEIAYFRGLMRQCETDPIVIGKKRFWYYLKGPDDKGIDWQTTKHFIFNDLNYTAEIYISNTPETKQFFQRFTKCKIKGKSFEVQAVDDLSTNGILTIYLKEDYNNSWADAMDELQQETVESRITGAAKVYPYDIQTYTINGAEGGVWLLDTNCAKILSQTADSATIEITTGRSGSVNLIYRIDSEDIVQPITILSL